MSRGPLPSQLCFLSSLPERCRGEKVRFLGCVTSYSTASAVLELGHLYPAGTNVTVSVNVQLVLETLPSQLTRVGEWVNVIGYVVETSRAAATSPDSSYAHIQALVIWPTGPLNIQLYEKELEANGSAQS
ncbi:hypothetical protein CDD81_7100 [Ophiocordyceps australis]|uniref:CST complex subunit Ten1 n=1 Tax=Ophiocordyceps australis TaxID=1399860 RepID=A0A2C5Y480_9HYPO|nr:hypothetical protein CDD81_7100 [Ophiocordyceps australis]